MSVKRQSSKIDRFCMKIIDRVFRPMNKGTLVMNLPDGNVLKYGQDSSVMAEIDILDMKFFRKCVVYGAVGFGEAYVEGDWDTKNITAVISWMILNYEDHPTLAADKRKRKPVNFLNLVNKLYGQFRKNTLTGSRKNISEHYDLHNDFFSIFLDPTMTYSSAYFVNSDQSLEDAQIMKYDNLCKNLKLQASDHVLEIGSGWGGFAVHAAKNYGCQVTTITISEEQFKYAKERFVKEGVDQQIDIQLTDYRLFEGQFDKIVSIEMIEAVGHKFLPDYFRKIHELLKKDGMLALQMILFPDHRYDIARNQVDWIQKHIFPGSLLPSVGEINKVLNKTGTLNLHHYEDITPSYVKTLKLWYDVFNSRLDEVRLLGFSDSFIRKWNYYLCYCEAAFEMRNISVAQAVYSRPNNLKLNDSLEMNLSMKDNEFMSELSEKLK